MVQERIQQTSLCALNVDLNNVSITSLKKKQIFHPEWRILDFKQRQIENFE